MATATAQARRGGRKLIPGYYTTADIAEFAGVKGETTRNWFEEHPGVIKYQRGKGVLQKDALRIPHEVAHAYLRERGHSTKEIEDRLHQVFLQRLEEQGRTSALKAPAPPGRKKARKTKRSQR